MNQPSRAEKFVLPDGVRKLTFTRDTKVANAGTYVVQKEDHTLGNIVRDVRTDPALCAPRDTPASRVNPGADLAPSLSNTDPGNSTEIPTSSSRATRSPTLPTTASSSR